MKNAALIRTARPADAAPLSALMRATFLAANGHCGAPHNVSRFLDAAYRPELQVNEIRDPDTLTVIVEQEGRWAGFAQLRWGSAVPPEVIARHAVELGLIYFAPEFHGLGIAAQLVANLLAAARVRGSHTVWLSVWQESQQALRFYRKHGFEIVGRSTVLMGDELKQSRVMAQALPQG
jgi:diamine N-acetyltransferase